jgi:formamidopyrimidine-DNA glycosylase
MPELPEVETVLQGLKPILEGAVIDKVIVRQGQLRWPVPILNIGQQKIGNLSRRGKYLLIPVQTGTVLIHLGMSGSLRIIPYGTAVQKHDHVDVVLASKHVLRYTDPRRFGAILWVEGNPYEHPLLKKLGPEPLTSNFSGNYLFHAACNRRKTIKELIMDNKVVVGIGNIYAAEALFRAQIYPAKAAGLLSELECERLYEAILLVLRSSIQQGGTTVKDFINSAGKPGYFAQELQVYGRGGKACKVCHTILQALNLGQRSTVFCPSCQPAT